jgi:hypothetical protein
MGNQDKHDDTEVAEQPVTSGVIADTTAIPNSAKTAAGELAWSLETEPAERQHQSWGVTWQHAALLLILPVVGLIVAITFWIWGSPFAGPPAPPSPKTIAGPALDGIYEIASDNAQQTFNGKPSPAGDITRYWAFRSVCTSTGCVATAAEVSDTNHQVANDDHDHSTWRWNNGAWREDPDSTSDLPCDGSTDSPKAASTMVRTLAPQLDGTLKGMEIDTVNDDKCGAATKDGAIKFPIAARRIADSPPGLVADPAIAVPPATPTPAAAPSIPPPAAAPPPPEAAPPPVTITKVAAPPVLTKIDAGTVAGFHALLTIHGLYSNDSPQQIADEAPGVCQRSAEGNGQVDIDATAADNHMPREAAATMMKDFIISFCPGQ